MKLISIIIPVYNSERYLRQCLDSLINQSYPQIEIICVDDGSADRSTDLLHEYAERDDRIRVFSKKHEGKGAAAARNLGLDNAKGDYIIFLDSDDFFELQMLEKMLGRAGETDADLVICTARHFDDRSQTRGDVVMRPELDLAPQKEPFSWKDCPEEIFQIADVVSWNKLFRKKLLDDHAIRFEAIAAADDQYPAIMGAVLAERIAVVKEPLINYRIRTGNSQVDSLARHPKASYEPVFSVVNCMKEMGIYEQVKKSYCNITILLMQRIFDWMDNLDDLRMLYHKYRDEIFPFIGADALGDEFFYDQRVCDWYKMVNHFSLEEILFMASRAGGGGMTTAPLRFQAPVSELSWEDNVAVIGKNRAGRYWYSQLILSECCNEVYWVASKDDLPDSVRIDKYLIAK